MPPVRRTDLALAGVGVFVVALDQLTKHIIAGYFGSSTPKAPIQVLGPLLDIEYVQNRGVAFSLFNGQGIKYVFILAAVALVGYLYWRTRDSASFLLTLTYGLILGGAIGNLLDRFTLHYVVDFIHFQIPQLHFDWPVFNVADSAISIGVVALAILLWRTTETPPKAAAPADDAESARDVTAPRVRRKVAGGR